MLNRGITWIMLVSGTLTCTMVYAAIAPNAMLQTTFGQALEGPLAELVVRNWGALIFLVGVMLIYAAFAPTVRPLVLVVAAASKAVFVALVLANGFARGQAAVAIAVDCAMVVLFLSYLVTRRPATS